MTKGWLFCAVVLLVCFFASSAKASDFLSDGDCYIDANGRQVCPLKKAAAVTGNVLQAAANAVTPNNSTGGVKTWTSHSGQPVRNFFRRLRGR